jgi:hypothetical protein
MNLLKTIIERLNQRVEVANIFDQIYPLCELNANGNDKAWVHYIGNGQAEVVTNFDAKQGTLFWAKRGKVSVTKTESLKVSGCKTLYLTTFPLTAYAVVRKSHLPCDSEDSQDWIASRIYRLISGTDPDFKVSIGVIQYEVIPNGYINEIKSLTANYEWACVAVDVDVNVVSSSEDGCYDVCATGDIPLPDFQPCTPCLTEVAVDGVTIIGNGTIGDPLVAIGGGGSILLKTDGVNNGSQSILNLKEGTNITISDDGVGGVTIDASGGGLTPSLQDVTDIGNSTTNDISFGSGVGAIFNNGAKVKEGTTDAGLGGAKGVAMICSNAYELKWEAGRLYYMEQNGFTIREVTHNFTITPAVTDDSTKGFVVGSRWTLDNGDLYVCSDDTIGAAVWNLQSVGGVADVTATAPLSSSGGTNPDISITQADGTTDGYLSQTDWNTFDGKFNVPTGLVTDYLDGLGSPTPFPTIPNAQVNSDWNATTGVEEILNKPTIPAAQVNSDWNATSGVEEILNKPTIVSSVNSGTNINVDNTDAANPIINSLADRYKTSSVTSNSVSNGSKSFAVDINLSYIPLQEILVVFNPANHMHGEVTSYDAATGALVVDIKNHTGSGTYTSWVLNLDGTPVDAITGSGTSNEIAYFTAARIIASLPVATYPSLTELSYVKGVTSAIQTQINAKQDAITLTTSGSSGAATLVGATLNIPQYSGGGVSYKSTTDGIATSTNNITLSHSQLITGGTFAVGDIIRLYNRMRATGATGTKTQRIYVNVTNDLTGTPILLATFVSTVAVLFQQIKRDLVIKSATNTETLGVLVVASSDDIASNTVTSSNIDWTTNKYIIFTNQRGSLTDTLVSSSFIIEKL